jgi:acyl carrier protein
MQPVPVGVRGELCIGGDGVSFGYLNRPELTSKQFVPDLFRDDPDALIYKTGDLCIYHPDGNIEYLNRIDNQVQVRGFRIELGEIETILGEHDAIKQGVVAVREERPGDTRLVAYYVSKPDRDIVTTELRSHLRAKLPDYMIPQHFVELELMPLTPAGKVDRKALPKPEADGSLEQGYVAPRTQVEKVLAKIWGEVLGLERVGVHDNFFELGGHSLLATQVMSRAHDNFEMELPLLRLFETPTIAGLTELIETIRLTKQGPRSYRETTTSNRKEGEI